MRKKKSTPEMSALWVKLYKGHSWDKTGSLLQSQTLNTQKIETLCGSLNDGRNLILNNI